MMHRNSIDGGQKVPIQKTIALPEHTLIRLFIRKKRSIPSRCEVASFFRFDLNSLENARTSHTSHAHDVASCEIRLFARHTV